MQHPCATRSPTCHHVCPPLVSILVMFPSTGTYCVRKMLFHNSSSIKSCNITTVSLFVCLLAFLRHVCFIILDPLQQTDTLNDMPTHCTATLSPFPDSSPHLSLTCQPPLYTRGYFCSSSFPPACFLTLVVRTGSKSKAHPSLLVQLRVKAASIQLHSK